MNTNYGSTTTLQEANRKHLLHSYDSLRSNEIHTFRSLKLKKDRQWPKEKEQNGQQRSTKYYTEN
jgi:hypothetical protein